MTVLSGKPTPLGLDIQGDEANFAIFSHQAEEVILGIFTPEGSLTQEIPLQRTGDIWHAAIRPFPQNGTYAFRIINRGGKKVTICASEAKPDQNEWLADPYARSLQSPADWGTPPEKNRSVRAFIAPRRRKFDWQGTSSPKIPKQDLIIYEMHVRGFTKHSSSQVAHPGTFKGVIEKIDHLKKLGVNAIELMPLFEFDETHVKAAGLCNYWGYNPLHYFSPMRRFAKNSFDPFGPIDELKELIREMHKNQIEVFLDVVYNHTGEGKELDYKINFRGIDPNVYYMHDANGNLRDYTGCGNCLNANHPIVEQLILDSLRYWVEEFQIDGFRFDLAAMLTRDINGSPTMDASILKKIASDPVISRVKLIAESWDAAGLYLVGSFAQKWHWSEWNGPYRDHVRRFIKGDTDSVGNFMNALCGSDFVFRSSKTPLSSINFITAHDGFTLRDLVSYNYKHNMANGEQGKDGSDSNDSWNCGFEGVTDNQEICSLRERQMRNFLLALFLSQGIPMLCMRDEYGHSCQGNNNPYTQDNEINWFVWNEREDIVDFVSQLVNFRKRHPLLRRTQFLTEKDIVWHGPQPNHPDIGPDSRFIAFKLVDASPLYAAFNNNNQSVELELPSGNWQLIVNTEKPWHEQGFKNPSPLSSRITLAPYSSLLAVLNKKFFR